METGDKSVDVVVMTLEDGESEGVECVYVQCV